MTQIQHLLKTYNFTNLTTCLNCCLTINPENSYDTKKVQNRSFMKKLILK